MYYVIIKHINIIKFQFLINGVILNLHPLKKIEIIKDCNIFTIFILLLI